MEPVSERPLRLLGPRLFDGRRYLRKKQPPNGLSHLDICLKTGFGQPIKDRTAMWGKDCGSPDPAGHEATDVVGESVTRRAVEGACMEDHAVSRLEIPADDIVGAAVYLDIGNLAEQLLVPPIAGGAVKTPSGEKLVRSRPRPTS